MTHTPQPPSDMYPSGEQNTGQSWLARRLGGVVTGAEGARPPETFRHGPMEVSAIADAMPASKLVSGQVRKLESPFTHGHKMDNGEVAGVLGVVLAGDTAVAVVGSYKDGRPSKFDFVELAVGSHAVSGGGKGSGKLLRSASSKPEGVQPYNYVTVGRSELGEDTQISRKHFTAIVTEAGVTIRDGGLEGDGPGWRPSMNGTTVLAAREFNDIKGQTDPRALQIMSELNTEPYTWLPDSTQHATIIRPQ